MKSSVLEQEVEIGLKTGTLSQPTLPTMNVTRCGIRCFNDYLTDLESRLKSGLARRAIAVLRAEPTAFVSVGEWASRLGVSREHLTRTFSPVITPHALILSMRQALAMQRLSQQSVLRAGEALSIMGYSSRAHAFTVFRLTTGMTPSEWWHRYHNSPSEREKCMSIKCLFQEETLEHHSPAALKASGNGKGE